MNRRGYLLMDAVFGLTLLAILLGGLHQLRSVQARLLADARLRLIAGEAAYGAALLAAQEPASIGRPTQLSTWSALLRIGKTLPDGQLRVRSERFGEGLVRVVATVTYRAGAASRIEEAERLARAQ